VITKGVVKGVKPLSRSLFLNKESLRGRSLSKEIIFPFPLIRGRGYRG